MLENNKESINITESRRHQFCYFYYMHYSLLFFFISFPLISILSSIFSLILSVLPSFSSHFFHCLCSRSQSSQVNSRHLNIIQVVRLVVAGLFPWDGEVWVLRKRKQIIQRKYREKQRICVMTEDEMMPKFSNWLVVEQI